MPTYSYTPVKSDVENKCRIKQEDCVDLQWLVLGFRSFVGNLGITHQEYPLGNSLYDYFLRGNPLSKHQGMPRSTVHILVHFTITKSVPTIFFKFPDKNRQVRYLTLMAAKLATETQLKM
jgi:hypothetical protein